MKIRIFPIILFFITSSLNLTSYGMVRIGTPLFQPPFVINAKDVPLQGFDISLMDLICQRLKWQCEYIPVPDNDFFTALTTNTIDYAIGGIVITPARRQAFLFSTPYLPSNGGFITLLKSPIKTLDDLNNKRVGALEGKIYGSYLSSHFSTAIKVSIYPIYSDLILALKNNEIDAIFLNYDSALFLVHKEPSILRVLDKPINLGEGMGILTTYDHSADIEEINKILLQNETDGTFIKLYNYYFEFFTSSGH